MTTHVQEWLLKLCKWKKLDGGREQTVKRIHPKAEPFGTMASDSR